MSSLTDSYSLLKALNNYSGFSKENTEIKIIANKVSNIVEGRNLYTKLNLVTERFLEMSLGFLGAVPMDEQIIKAVMQQSPISISYPNSKASKAFERLSAQLTGTVAGNRKSLAEVFSSYFNRKSDK